MSDRTDAEMALELGNRWAVRVGGSAISSDEYVPTEDEVRHYVSTNGRMPADWFDRWLVEHDCEVEARGLEKAAGAAFRVTANMHGGFSNWLNRRAQQVREGN